MRAPANGGDRLVKDLVHDVAEDTHVICVISQEPQEAGLLPRDNRRLNEAWRLAVLMNFHGVRVRNRYAILVE